jgi:crotonobetainyl-CoA:carnitine CoA-transferase CaiB-like acyl-CoA transferase
VMLSSSLMGQTGPLARFAGFGTLAAPVVGFTDITGWPDRPPAGPFAAYTDYVSPRFAIATLLAALDHRRRNGQGQHIDLAQAEASAHFLAPALLDYALTGRVLERCGNTDVDMAPHGVFRCAGVDAWVAIACCRDEDWPALCSVIGRHDLAHDAALRRVASRRDRAADLEDIITRWTMRRSPDEAAQQCRESGVAAHAVYTSAECAADPQLRERNHLVDVDHPLFDKVTVEGPRVLLSRTPGRAGSPPVLGQHTWEILQGSFGYRDEDIAELYATGVLG